MTPSQTARANELANKKYQTIASYREKPITAFLAGYSSAVADMEDAAGKEFNFDSRWNKFCEIDSEEEDFCDESHLQGAIWQHSQDFALIAKLREEIERLKVGE